MNRNTNIIFSLITACLCLGAVVVLVIVKNYTIALALLALAILFFSIFDHNVAKKRLYVNPFNLLPLKSTAGEGIKQRLRKNLATNGFLLEDGFYVNTKGKYYDVYFSTYTKDNLKEKLAYLCKKLNKDGEYLLSVAENSGYTNSLINVDVLRENLLSGARRYDNQSLFTHKKRNYVILLGIDDVTESKPMFTFWMLPFNSATSVDQLAFVDLSAKEGIARLDTVGNTIGKNPALRTEVRKIFKNVIDFDCTFDNKTLSRLEKFIN